MHIRVYVFAAICLAARVPVFAGDVATAVTYAGGNRFAPFQYVDAEGEPQGFVIELLHAIAREANLDINVRLSSWPEAAKQLDAGTADISAVALSASRSTRYLHVVPVWHLRQVALYRSRREAVVPRRLEDLSDDTVAVTAPSALHDDLMALPRSVRPQIIPVPGAREAIEALRSRAATVAVGNALGFEALHGSDGIPGIEEAELRSIPYSIVVRRGREDLVPIIIAAYTKLHDSGELSAILERTLLRTEPDTAVERWGIYVLGLFGVGAVALLTVTAWNRTLRSQVEARTAEFQAVVQRLELHGLVQSQVSDAIIVLNAERDITMWNNGAEVLFGIPASEAIGKSSARIVQALAAGTDLQGIQRQVERDGLWRGEATITRADGTKVQVEATVKILRDADGKPEGRLIVVHDIDARKRAEEELRSALSLHRATLESTNDGILALDETGHATSYNQRLLQMWGVSEEDLASPAAMIAAAKPKIVNFAEVVERWQQIRDAETYDVAVVTLTDGRVIERHTHPQRVAGSIVGRVFSYRDITDRLRAEEEGRKIQAQMQHVQKLESLGVLAGGIAHDFNNLLVGMLGHAGLALMDLPPDSPVRQRIEQIETCAVRASELTNQMLAYSGKGRFIVQPTDLTGVVREMTNLLQTAISKNARLELSLASELPAVSADVAQLRQVVMNLITNASDAIGERPGRIAVTTGVMHASHEYLAESFVTSAAEPGAYVFIEVRDDGCGMDAETRNRIFEPFFTTKFTGRGLGLAAVIGIVRGHHGAVRIDTTPAQGTTFRVLFPASGSPATATVQATRKARAAKQARVLVVDDEPAVRMIAREALTRAGFTVVIARDGEEAVKRMREEGKAIDVVLLDMTMPGLNGVDTLRAIHGIVPGVPVVLTSGYSEQDAADRCHGEVMAGFIQKPFAPAALVTKMNDALSVGAKG